MNKIFKLTGVSMLAIMATVGANAAGYTCNELIEYTSCKSGYYLNAGQCSICPAGAACAGGSAPFYKCKEGMYQPLEGQDMCLYAPAGSYSSGVGSTTVEPCAGGTYNPYTGRSSCIPCPATGGDALAVTGATGATNVSDCYVASDTYFTDDKGTYRYKSNCSYSVTELELCEQFNTFIEEGECYCNDGKWVYDAESNIGYCLDSSENIPGDGGVDGFYVFDGCESVGGTWNIKGQRCDCESDKLVFYAFGTALNGDSSSGFYCVPQGFSEAEGFSEASCLSFEGTYWAGGICVCENGWKRNANDEWQCQ